MHVFPSLDRKKKKKVPVEIHLDLQVTNIESYLNAEEKFQYKKAPLPPKNNTLQKSFFSI